MPTIQIGALKITVPDASTIPSQARGRDLRALYRAHVVVLAPRLGWKGPCEAIVDQALVADVRDAMDFMGSMVDAEVRVGAHVRLFSRGYYAHGF